MCFFLAYIYQVTAYLRAGFSPLHALEGSVAMARPRQYAGGAKEPLGATSPGAQEIVSNRVRILWKYHDTGAHVSASA